MPEDSYDWTGENQGKEGHFITGRERPVVDLGEESMVVE